MPCYDQFKAERLAKAKKQHKNPLVEQFADAPKAAQRPAAPPQQQPSPQEIQPRPPQRPVQRAPAKAPAPSPAPAEKPQAAPQTSPAVETCDVCRKPLDGFKFPLKGGKKVCLECNNLLREMAKALILNVQCPHCGKEIQLNQE